MEYETEYITDEQFSEWAKTMMTGGRAKFPNGLVKTYMIKQFPMIMEERLKCLNKKYYDYFITFTLKDESDAASAEAWIMNRKNCDYFVSASYVEERTVAGVKHWHMILKASKSLEKARFKYYERYGFVDFKRITPNTDQNVHDYINKIGNVITL